ncbi:MAG: hypothetical protein D6736_10480 [Nitrospinota bacterium]|nr:MAG: hypothetical protein D6736_10480 [Nitrospinota bacterium]
MRVLNAGSTNPQSFTDELTALTGSNGLLDGYGEGTDDVPLLGPTALGAGTYTVYLTNDLLEGASNPIDGNGKVTLTAVASGPQGSQAVVESTVALFPFFPLPAAITLLGSGASFLGGSSNAKVLHGDDQCGTDPPRPVIAVSDAADLGAVQGNIAATEPQTYHTRDALGHDVTAVTDPDAIATVIAASTLSSIAATSGIDLLQPDDLRALVTRLQDQADTVAAGGTNAALLDMGTPAHPRLVVAGGDFTLDADGAGILVVTGKLFWSSAVNYHGLLLVLGTGEVKRYGMGNGRIEGGILVANLQGPDNLPGTADDSVALGPPTMDLSGGGDFSLLYCSTTIEQAFLALPLRVVALRHRS